MKLASLLVRSVPSNEQTPVALSKRKMISAYQHRGLPTRSFSEHMRPAVMRHAVMRHAVMRHAVVQSPKTIITQTAQLERIRPSRLRRLSDYCPRRLAFAPLA